jgi:excisionase family DNA binding protein
MRYTAEHLRLPEDLLTYSQAWAMLGISRTTLTRLLAAGELERIIIGGRPRILRPSLIAYLGRQLGAAQAARPRRLR